MLVIVTQVPPGGSTLGGRPARLLLHPAFVWTSHVGETFDREKYVHANTSNGRRWRAQRPDAIAVKVVGDAAVLTCLVTDELEIDEGIEVFHVPMTQTWILSGGRWLCLSGHAGPLLS